jgi:tetratricopeptide (TPR) repeat protein
MRIEESESEKAEGRRQKAEGARFGVPNRGTQLIVTAVLALLTGCAAHDNNVKTLRQGYDALAVQQYSTAMDDANAVLAANADGTLPAEAHYLRGRVFEETAMSSSQSSAQATNLQNARDEYRQAISLPHRTDLDGDARAGVALVAFYQDDYATALQQWQMAYPELKKPEDRVRTLYRMGQSAQRLGQWALADQFFQQVQQQAPGTDVANNARMHEGARAFVVQVGTFTNPHLAIQAEQGLRASGINAGLSNNPSGGGVSVRTGPLPTYGQAKSLRDRLLGRYPNVLILP